MEVFGELENNTQAIHGDKNPKTLLKTTHFDDENNTSDSDDDYELHQSRLDAEQFEFKDDLEVSKPPSRLVSAIQKVKERIKLQQLKENEIKSQSETTKLTQSFVQNNTQEFEKTQNIEETPTHTLMQTAEITQTITLQQEETQQSTQDLKHTGMIAVVQDVTQPITQVITQKLSGALESKFDVKGMKFDEDDNDDQIIKRTQRTNAIVDSDDDVPDNEHSLFVDKPETTQTEITDSNNPDQLVDNGTMFKKEEDEEILPAKNQQDNNSNDDDEDDDDDEIMPSKRHRIASSVKNEGDYDDDDPPIQQSTNLASLFVSEDENSENEALDDGNDDIAKRIENYENMSKEQRYLARKIERSKIREEKRNAMADKSEVITQRFHRQVTPRLELIKENKFEVAVKKEKLKTHTILKKANEEIKIFTEKEYSKDKLLEQLQFENDSEEEKQVIHYNLQAASKNSETKNSIKPVRNLIKENEITNSAVDIIELSESENDEDEDDADPLADISLVQKAKKLDLSLKYSKKKKQKMEKVQKLSFTDRIQKMKAKELKDKLSIKLSESKTTKTTYTDAELAKMLLQDQMNNSSRAKKKKREQRRLERQQQLLKEGTLTHDDDDPEFSSDYDISDESEDYGSGDDDDDNEEDKNDKENNEEGNNEDIQQSAAGLFDTSGKLGEFNFTLSNMGENVRTQDNSFDGLTSAEKFAKLKQIPEADDLSEHADSTTYIQPSFRNEHISEITIQSQSINESSNFQLHDILDSQNLVLETQADGMEMSTQKLDNDSVVASISTQKLESFVSTEPNDKVNASDKVAETVQKIEISDTIVSHVFAVEEKDEDDEDEQIQVRRKKRIDSSDDEDAENLEETEEEMQKRAELIKLAKKKQREEARKREAEFKAKGLGDIVEKEAVESEDEFHGVGGGDRDFSDEENSEDEKMIDDATNANIGEDEIRKFHLDKELEEDQAKVAKTYKDVKTHELGKRRAKDSVFDVSDSDDDEMDEQRRMIEFIRKRRLREEKELRANNDFKLDANDPKKAFYDEINIKLPSHITIYKDSFTNSISDLDNNEDDESNRNSDIKDYYNGVDSTERPTLKKRKKSLLSNTLDDDIMYGSFHDQEADRMKAEVLSDNTDDEDNDGSKMLKLLKKKTSVKLTRKLVVPKPKAKETTEDLDETNSFGLLTKSNSITSSFKKSTQKKIKISANTGNVIREVSVTTSSKSVANSKAAVTGLSSSSSFDENINKKKVVRGSGLDRLDKMLAKSREKGIKSIGKR